MAKPEDAPMRKQLIDRRSRLERARNISPEDPQVERLLGEVDAALERMEQGTYGLCETCQGIIEPERLMADPLVHFCLDCLTPAQ